MGGCGKNERILLDAIEFKGSEPNRLAYYQGELFNGVAYKVHPNGTLKYEAHYSDGKLNGLSRNWDSNGMLVMSTKYVNGEERNLNGEEINLSGEMPAEDGYEYVSDEIPSGEPEWPEEIKNRWKADSTEIYLWGQGMLELNNDTAAAIMPEIAR